MATEITESRDSREKRRNPWIEAMRPQTLPVGASGVIAGWAVAISMHGFRWVPAVLCLLFAVLAQISSNFANEYFDYKKGLDKPGREGFRRGVSEGDLTPVAMRNATYLTLLLACAVGCGLIPYGGWAMIPVGVAVAVFALAYSAGPFPLSHHGLGDVAVVIFFGILPVCLTTWLQCRTDVSLYMALPISIGVGLMAANVLIVNNYRDVEDDRAVGKRTTVVIFGRKWMGLIYKLNFMVGVVMTWLPMMMRFKSEKIIWFVVIAAILSWFTTMRPSRAITKKEGGELNPVLGMTARSLLVTALLLLFCSFLAYYPI